MAMKLRNKKTGEIISCKEILILREDSEGIWQVGQGSSLAELNEEWEVNASVKVIGNIHENSDLLKEEE